MSGLSDAFAINENGTEEGDAGAAFAAAAAEEEKNAAAGASAARGARRETFPPVPKIFEDAPLDVFDNPAYYKTIFSSGSDSAKRLHTMYQKYATAKDPKDKSLFRQQIVNIYWTFCATVAAEAGGTLSEPKKFFLRFAMLNPNALTAESKTLFAKVPVKSFPDLSIYYLDEWFKKIGRGELHASTTDEVKTKGKSGSEHFRAIYEKAVSQRDGLKGFLTDLDLKRSSFEEEVKHKINFIMERTPSLEMDGVSAPLSPEQKSAITSVQEFLKSMISNNREFENQIRNYADYCKEAEDAHAKLEEEEDAEGASVDLSAITTEFDSIRQMAKMTIGRQGNAFPFLSGEYFHSLPDSIGTKENIIKRLAWIESIDCEVFDRTYKNRSSRIVPNIVLLPTYGDYGICWEPFEKMNKTTSRGRIAVPMYPKNLTMALLTAIGDFRWQMAKENSSFYWMEEGLTGNYYQWVQSQKLKGDLKQFFIRDYILWMTKEAEGIQKLDKEVRGIFWRFMPFAQDLKEKLKTRNLIYQELYQRDKNRQMSDGY